MQKKLLLSIFLSWCIGANVIAQEVSLNFHKIGQQDGLHDGTVRCITQDKFGYIWIGTVGALNRFDGKSFKHFTNIPGDTTSASTGQPRYIHSDIKGRLWIGFETGLAEFNFQHSTFRRIPFFKNHFIHCITSYGDSILFIGTNRGFIRYNIYTGGTFNYTTSPAQQHEALRRNGVNEMAIKSDSLFIASNRGLVIMDLRSGKVLAVSIPVLNGMPIRRIALDKNRNVWLGTFNEVKLVKLHADLGTTEVYDRFLSSAVNTQPLNVMGIMADSKDRIWVVTAIDGLLKYEERSNSFVKYLHNRNLSSSPSGNNYRCIFQDKKGTIWLGCDIRGVNFFDPDKNFFNTILPFPDRLDERERAVARAITEDKEGNLWMGNHDGVVKYNTVTKNYTVWRNDEGKAPVIYSNMVRAILCDDENNIWIGTGAGVNRYNDRTRKMEFIDSKDLPRSFYNSINKDRSGNLWFCTNDSASLYWYSLGERKFRNICDHPQLNKYSKTTPTSYVMEDSKNRIWISLSRRGVVMWDKKTGKTKQYTSGEKGKISIVGDQVVDIKEDRTGIIWITSFNGISGIDVEKDSIISFNNKNGLLGNWVAPMIVDSLNRIWLGVNGGLMLLPADRKQFTAFSINDGLPSVGFPEHAGVQLRNGDIIFPSNNGFIRFNPASFREEHTELEFYIAGYSVLNHESPPLNEEKQEHTLQLKASENSFTFNLVALNYINPGNTWFAYKLEGFEEEWHFTKDPKAVYTNVSGGKYDFYYKASTINSDWDKVNAKKLNVTLATVFYKTFWFRISIFLMFAGILYFFYKYRSKQHKKLYELNAKAQLLEKEKVMVMYESLKQQLNPHFLFNSLTSLSGLIETDQKVAGNFLEQMSGIYRYILKNGDSETVSLKDEIEFVKLYINLQQTRFKKGLNVNIDVPDEYLHYKIAPVTLQNMIENAIKHNIIDAGSPLVIDIFIENDYLVVKNNLQKKNRVETSNRKGLTQFISLYKYFIDLPVLIEERDKYFQIKIPLI
jgi:ligand-binding sensor domain-containing protein